MTRSRALPPCPAPGKVTFVKATLSWSGSEIAIKYIFIFFSNFWHQSTSLGSAALCRLKAVTTNRSKSFLSYYWDNPSTLRTVLIFVQGTSSMMVGCRKKSYVYLKRYKYSKQIVKNVVHSNSSSKSWVSSS